MKKLLSLMFLSVLLTWSTIGVGAAGLWTQYVAPDGSYSFHYPQGWKVTANESMVVIESSQTDEQLLLAGVPFDPRKSPQELAGGFLNLLKGGNPTVSAANWRSDPGAANSRVIFDLFDTSNGKQYNGLGMVIKTDDQATWFSYTAPAAGFSPTRSISILQGFIGSLASGSATKMPTLDYNVDASTQIDRNAQAFLFVLEFALGAPFTKAQEDVILNELQTGWRSLSATELSKYDQYPLLVQSMLKMGRKDLEDLRLTLEKSTREWLAGADPSDKAVKIIRLQLQLRGRILMAGDPPLTEMSLTAYSEIIVFSRLLQQNYQATPDQITSNSVSEIKKQVLKVWGSFSKDDRQSIATTPGLWLCIRTLLRSGTKAEQEKIRSQLQQLEATTRNLNTNNNTRSNNNTNNSSSAPKPPLDMTTHGCLMQIQQQTFNTYMWSRGFNYSPATGKMW